MSRKPTPSDFFNEEMAQVYDERNSNLAPVKDALLFTMKLVLNELPEHSRVLSVGAGTGEEILTLSGFFPNWSFVAIEPSEPMLAVCKKRLTEAGIADKCEFIHGYVEDVSDQDPFDAVISLFVGHFIARDERVTYFQNMIQRVRNDGYLVHSEISFDLDSKQFPQMLQKWGEVQKLMGGTSETLKKLPDQLRNMLTVLPPEETERQIQQGGVDTPIRFFQALMICGWFAKK